MKNSVLNGMSTRQFLRDYWQKRPLLICQAVPGFKGLLSFAEMQALALRDDMQSRLVRERQGEWQVQHGPLRRSDYRGLKQTHWSLLVQGIEQQLASGRELLALFNFIPYARLDDLMVSFAPEGGGVGPHLDSYDVFLLQGGGHKRWQVSAQTDQRLIADAPLRLLRYFQPEQEWILGPGDMLYLPPRYAHYGVALNDNFTYSIGFRAPSRQELLTQFLTHMQDHLEMPGMYSDPDLKPCAHPAEINRAMLDQVESIITGLRWQRKDIVQFLGRYLTEPKPHVVFEPAPSVLSFAKFTAAIKKRGLKLALKSQMLFAGGAFFINGEALDIPRGMRKLFIVFADQRHLSAEDLRAANQDCISIFYDWYEAAYIEIDSQA